jgi:hypothetical protein
MAIKWLAQLDIHSPSLGQLARDLDNRDGFDIHLSRKKRKIDKKAAIEAEGSGGRPAPPLRAGH